MAETTVNAEVHAAVEAATVQVPADAGLPVARFVLIVSPSGAILSRCQPMSKQTSPLLQRGLRR